MNSLSQGEGRSPLARMEFPWTFTQMGLVMGRHTCRAAANTSSFPNIMSTSSSFSRIEASAIVIPSKQQNPRFPVLDTIRGFAFLLVLFAHIGQARGFPSIGMGQFGVWIFFVLSAFLLSYPFFSQPSTLGQPQVLGVYCIRRFLRIFPPLALALVAFHFLRAWGWDKVWRNLIVLRGDGLLWTVYIETRYYLLLPLIVAAVTLLWRRPVLLGSVLIVALGLQLIDAPFWKEPKTWYAWGQGLHAFFQYLPLFVSGTLLARLHVAVSRSNLWSARLGRSAPVCTVASLLVLALLSPAAPAMNLGVCVPPRFYYCWWVPMIPLICGLVFFPLFLGGELNRFLAHPGFRFFGMISYSGYLFHMIFVERFATISSNGLFVIVVVGASCLIATLAHYLVERPFGALAQSLNRFK
ncbi:MAG TPA: acyltransferase [Lacunisphaera sp.]|jgi:peptidoglycan/LPS O-acetylase OafA/YrhL